MKKTFGGLLIAATILTPIAPAAAQANGERIQIAQRGDRGDHRGSRGTDGRLIALALGFGALGDYLLDARGLIVGALAFAAGHVTAIILYWRNRRPALSAPQRGLGWLTVPAALVIAWGLTRGAPDGAAAVGYTALVAAMAASAWTSRFPRYRTGIGAMLFLASDLFIFAGEGGALSKDVTLWLVWPLYFAGQALIAWGVVSTLSREGDRA